MSGTDASGNVPCVSYGFGSNMVPTQGTCSEIPAAQCSVTEGMTGAGMDAYPNMTCPQALDAHKVKIRGAQLTVALADSNYSTLAALVGSVEGLTKTLTDSAGAISVLAPSNAAFAKLSDELVAYLTTPSTGANFAEANALLAQILKYHVVQNDATLEGSALPIIVPIETILIPPDIDTTSLPFAVFKDATDTTTTPPPPPTTAAKALVPRWLQRPRSNNNWT